MTSMKDPNVRFFEAEMQFIVLSNLISHLNLPQVSVDFSSIFWDLIYIKWLLLSLNHRHVHRRV